MPLEFFGSVDVDADERGGFFLGEGGGEVEGFVVVDAEVFAAEPVDYGFGVGNLFLGGEG